MKTELEKFSDQMALMEMCVQLEDEQKKIFDALPKLKDEFSKEAKAEFARLTKQAEAIEWKLAEARGEYLKTVEANRAEFARMEQSIKAKGTELAEYSKRLQSEVPAPVEQKIKAIFETLPRPANGKDGANGKDASLLTGFRGNWDADTTYRAGDWFTFRGSSYLVLRACKGQVPTKNSQGEPNAYYAVFAMSGAPGIVPVGVYLPTSGGAVTGRVTLGTTTDATVVLNISHDYTAGVKFGASAQSVVKSDITSSAYGFYSGLTTENAAFTLPVMRQYAAFLLSKGAASTLTTNVGYYVGAAASNSGTNRYGFQGELVAGAGFNLYMNGTGFNYLAGSTGIGVAASDTAALSLAASTAAVASLIIAQGTAPSSPSDGMIWMTSAGLYYRANGVTVGPLAA